jgi:hypothetical protein
LKPIASTTWKSAEIANLHRATGRRIVVDETPGRIFLWTVKEANPVPRSGATDYLILRRECVLSIKGPDPNLCIMTGWSVFRIRSLVNTLMTD